MTTKVVLELLPSEYEELHNLQVLLDKSYHQGYQPMHEADQDQYAVLLEQILKVDRDILNQRQAL